MANKKKKSTRKKPASRKKSTSKKRGVGKVADTKKFTVNGKSVTFKKLSCSTTEKAAKDRTASVKDSGKYAYARTDGKCTYVRKSKVRK